MRSGKQLCTHPAVRAHKETSRLDTSLIPAAKGFTLIELLVVMAVLAILASVVVPRYMDKADMARETVLRQDLQGLRTAIDQYYRDQGVYPPSLQALVDKRYIRAIPLDPITNSTQTWVVIAPRDGSPTVFDVKTGAKQRARDGSDYASW
jgi:general secretion pathway protein G